MIEAFSHWIKSLLGIQLDIKTSKALIKIIRWSKEKNLIRFFKVTRFICKLASLKQHSYKLDLMDNFPVLINHSGCFSFHSTHKFIPSKEKRFLKYIQRKISIEIIPFKKSCNNLRMIYTYNINLLY